jgi:hypothetical protein
MPRGSGKLVTPIRQEQRRLLFEMVGEAEGEGLRQWDPKAAPLVEAILGILASGAAVFLRPGSGGRAIGVAIWEGDTRHPARWVYEAEELDDWARIILKRLGDDISQAAD